MTQTHTIQNPARGRPAQRAYWLLATMLLTAALAATLAPRAGAVTDAEELTRFGGPGSAAGELGGSAGIAADPNTGHVYVSDYLNRRIDEFTPWGNFVKAFGWDVAPSAVNEQQEVRVRASGGQFTLGLGASPAATTGDIAFNAPGSEAEGTGSVEAALNALSTIGGAGGSVSVEAVPGLPDGQIPYVYVITFKGSLAGTDVPQLVASNGTTPPSGGVPSTNLEARTRADGTPGGTGLESCTAESECKKGLEGAGAGQFANPSGIAVDAAGNLYIKEVTNRRVQKLDSAGRFLLTFGNEVNKTTSADRCTAAQLQGGDECGAGAPGTGPGEFGPGFAEGLAINSAGKLFVADAERIQRFNSEGEFETAVPVPGEMVHYLALDPLSGAFYVRLDGTNEILKLDPASGVEIGRLPGTTSPLATDPAGDIFARKSRKPGEEGGLLYSVMQFDSAGTEVSEFGLAELLPESNFPGVDRFDIVALATNAIGDVYVVYASSFVRVFGPGPASFEAPPRQAPTIKVQFATSVDRTGATLRADINPHFWTDAHYYVQYGTGKCSEGGCDESQPAAPGPFLTNKVTGSAVRSAGVTLERLKPGTTYHYRFVAQSFGGGPVMGEEKSFTTYPAQAPPKTDCPNQGFRTSLSALLPDCRAYEMVSPVDKENGDIRAVGSSAYLDLSSPDGGRFTYSSYRAFPDAKSAPYTSQYLATRIPGEGWRSEGLSVGQGPAANTILNLYNQYKSFSADLCTSWLVTAPEPALAPGASEGYFDVYRRDGCEEPDYEALIQVKPTIEPADFDIALEMQGASVDGTRAILRVKDKLTEDATADRWQAYYANEGALHLLCVLPGGLPSHEHCSGGTGGSSVDLTDLHRRASLSHAISVDGSRVYWTSTVHVPGPAAGTGPGTIYMRENPDQPESGAKDGDGNCIREAGAACTVAVSGTETNRPSRFLGASPDGAKALFEVDDPTNPPTPKNRNLYLFDLEAEASSLIAGKVVGVAGTSEDLARVYFVSEEALDGEAKAGQPNLYLSEEGTVGFIATLARADAGRAESISNTPFEPPFHVARASADGASLAFISTASLTGYDNTDLASPLTCGSMEGAQKGICDSEVYLYRVGAPGPVCVSCNPSGARPKGRTLENGTAPFSAAATLPLPQGNLNFPHSLSADGSRLFFESFDALLPRDTNGKRDVYEWQEAGSAQACTEAGAELYVESSGGCLSLISSGQSREDAKFLDASANGGDAFFTTSASLLPQDPGLIDVYDARSGGGFPPPPARPALCEGEACQGAPSPPDDPTPASSSFQGAGNVSPSCAKGKTARKGRCVAKKLKRVKRHAMGSKRTASHNRGPSR